MKDSRITHHIVDRPRLVQSYDSLPKSREYVQPQWLLDCANFMFVLPVAKYGVGEPLPPHLSPWVDDEEEGYKPAYAEEIARIKNGETIEETEAMADEQDGDEESVEEMEVEDEDDDEEAEEEEEPVAPTEQEKKKKKKKKKRKTASADEEAHELARSMMSRKAAHLYGRMQHGLAQKNQKAEVLLNRRKEIDSKEIDGKEKDKLGKTVLKQKVERLKSERKVILDTYAAAGGSMKKKKRTGGKS
jgi:pescadillo protein